jgi:hypothetical protein
LVVKTLVDSTGASRTLVGAKGWLEHDAELRCRLPP